MVAFAQLSGDSSLSAVCVIELGRKRVTSEKKGGGDENLGKRKAVVELSRIESLPTDVLTRVVCGVDHEDLGKLLLVSKTIKKAALLASKMHFAYTTPSRKSTVAFRTSVDLDDTLEDEVKAPNAPMLKKRRLRNFDQTKFVELSLVLFPDEGASAAGDLN